MNKNYFLLLILFIVQNYSCKKSTIDNTAMHIGTVPDVYVTGSANGLAVYWKNDSVVYLPEGGDAVDIYVSGNDVYVGGTSFETGLFPFAAYWKNDTLVMMSDGSNEAIVTSYVCFRK